MTIAGYHGTHRGFSEFDDAFIGSGGHHPNSALGHWFFTDERTLERFPGTVLQAELSAERCYEMALTELVRLSSEHRFDEDGGAGFFAGLRRHLLDQGYDSILLSEMDGTVSTAVALSADSIVSVRPLHPVAPGY